MDFVQPSPIKMGGVSELRKVFALAGAHKVTVMPHSFYDGPGLLAGVHVNAALGEGSLVEWRFFDLESRLYGDAAVPKRERERERERAGAGSRGAAGSRPGPRTRSGSDRRYRVS